MHPRVALAGLLQENVSSGISGDHFTISFIGYEDTVEYLKGGGKANGAYVLVKVGDIEKDIGDDFVACMHVDVDVCVKNTGRKEDAHSLADSVYQRLRNFTKTKREDLYRHFENCKLVLRSDSVADFSNPSKTSRMGDDVPGVSMAYVFKFDPK